MRIGLNLFADLGDKSLFQVFGSTRSLLQGVVPLSSVLGFTGASLAEAPDAGGLLIRHEKPLQSLSLT